MFVAIRGSNLRVERFRVVGDGLRRRAHCHDAQWRSSRAKRVCAFRFYIRVMASDASGGRGPARSSVVVVVDGLLVAAISPRRFFVPDRRRVLEQGCGYSDHITLQARIVLQCLPGQRMVAPTYAEKAAE